MRKKKNKNRYIAELNKEYTYKNKTQNGHKWIKEKKIVAGTFVRRINQYGINDERTFYSHEEMKAYVQKLKKKNREEKLKSNLCPKEAKTFKWKQDKEKLCESFKNIDLPKNSLIFQSRIDLVTALIADAKSNLLPRRKGKKSPYFNESKKWLMNGNGGLEYLLECIPGINTKESLKELRRYAEQFE